jgi:bifunctional DNase/RNase
MIQVNVEGLFLTQSQASGVILKEIGGERSLPIVIGDFEAQSIALGLENIEAPRPITHDLIVNMLAQMQASIEKIEITELKQNTFYALVTIQLQEGSQIQIDARPSDAIAIAVRSDIAIFVAENVLNKGGYSPEQAQFYPSRKNRPLPRNEDVEALEKQLQKAIEDEQYERAAQLKEKIRHLRNREQ